MNDRFFRPLLLIVALLLAALLVQPYLDAYLFRPTPRPIVPKASLSDFEQTSVSVFEAVAPSVVQVIAPTEGAPVGAGVGAATGSGFLWDERGHVVTNEHVVRDASRIAVRLASGRVVAARLVGRAPNYDIAVLRLDTSTGLPPPVPVGSNGDLQVGQVAFAIGNPFGFDQSLSMGVISAVNRSLPSRGGREIADVIQTDAAINPGNSGGPLLDSAGRLIGVNTAIFSPSGASAGIGFAIPVGAVNRVVPELIRSGRMPVPGIGIMAADETLAAHLDLGGVAIAEVVPQSPADGAGLVGFDLFSGSLGDVIVEVEGEPVRRLPDLTGKLESAGIGSTVELTVRRGDATRQVEVEVVDVGEF